MQVILKNVRLSYPDLFKRGNPPPDKPNEPGKYGGQFIFANDSDAARVAKQALMDAAKAEFGENWQAIVKAMEKSKKFLRNGDENLTTDGRVRDGYGGNLYVVARNKVQPLIIGPRKDASGNFPVLREEDGKPYGGCYVNVKIDVKAMKAKGNIPNQVYASLLTVQFVADGEAFGAAPGTAEGFEDEGDAPAAGGDGSADDLF